MQAKQQKFSPIKQRILHFADTLGISKREFYTKIGVSRGTLESHTGITEDVMAKFIATYPDVSLIWLLTGQGEMLKSPVPAVKAVTAFDLRTDRHLDEQTIPLYELDATAGLISLFEDSTRYKQLSELYLPDAPKCDGAIYVRGDSMYPILKSGDIVCYKTIHDHENIFYGEMYLLDFDVEGEQFLTIKYIQRSDRGDDYIRLVSHNSHHSPMDVRRSSVRGLALVKASVRYNSMK